MQIMFIHLSDMHIRDNRAYNSFQLNKIVDAAVSAGSVDYTIILLSGDIAFSGQSEQYVTANRCLQHIIQRYKHLSNNQCFINILAVPGNHDIAYPNEAERLTSAKLQDIRKVNSCERHINAQADLQKAFFQFASQKTQCEWSSNYQFQRKLIGFGDFTLEVNLINSGLFSTLDEDKGLHYLSQHCINSLIEPTGADFVITMMHHAPEWYTDDIKHQLDDIIYRKSSLVFLGHEHYIEHKAISHEDMPGAFIQAGGCLCENDNWRDSSFFIGVIDTDGHEYTQIEYSWNPRQNQYERAMTRTLPLVSKPSTENPLRIKSSFIRDFVRDVKHEHLSDDFRSYFVFPRIQQQNSDGISNGEIVSEDGFISEILDKKRILIYGGYNSGKSTLLKFLFLYFMRDFTPVYCSISNIHGTNTERMIRNSFEDTYGNDRSDYDRFTQLPKGKKIVIIDDADQISPESFDLFLKHLIETFEYVVMASKQMFDLNLMERAKAILKAEDSLYRYSIMPFYADKREELIKNVVKLKLVDGDAVQRTTRMLSDAITSQRRSIILDPDFIINYAEYYCNNIGEINNSDSSVFSKVFEANITTALSPFCQGTLSVNKIFTILGKIAYNIHFGKIYPMPRESLIGTVKQYNDDYGTNVSIRGVIETITRSKVMVEEESQTGEISYRFASRNYLAYFVAREVNAAYYTDHDSKDLEKIMRCACFGINADILLFISYITDNIQILNALLQMAESLIERWVEFDFDNENMPQYLRAASFKEIVTPPRPGDYEQQKQAEVEAERVEHTSLKIANIYDYSDDEAEELANQIIRACSLLIVIAKCLPGFEHNMKKAEKEAFVAMIYKMPNYIFGQWAALTDHVVSDIVEFFQSQGQDYYQRTVPTSKDDILYVLQRASIALLLDMYNMASYYSTKETTQGYLSNFDYKSRLSYSVEHLMMLERAKHTKAFTDEALELVSRGRSSALKFSVANIVRHAIVFVQEFQEPQINRLGNQFFSSRESRTQLMSQRHLGPYSTKKE